MLFNKKINGYQNEEEFARYLNGKKFGRVNPIFQDLLYKLYKNIDFNDTIICWVNKSKRKADIYIKVNNFVRGISIKKGVKNSVHVESITRFTKFLEEIGIEDNIIHKFLNYHFADGTINGSGKIRLSSIEYRKKYQQDINIINNEFNKKKYIDQFINRFILQGNKSEYEVDAIIYGVVEDFIWITNEEIKYIIRKHLLDNCSSLHISCLSLQPMSRNLNYNSKYEFCRYHIQIKWYNLSDQIIEVMSTYRNNRMKNNFDLNISNK